MADLRCALALLSLLLAGCATFDEAIIRTATLEDTPAPDCVQRVIESVAQPATAIQRRHVDWTNPITDRPSHSVDVFSFALDKTALPPVTISVSQDKNAAAFAIGAGWNYRFHWDYGRAEAHHLMEVSDLARAIERELSAQCGIAPFSERVRDSGGMLRSVPPLV